MMNTKLRRVNTTTEQTVAAIKTSMRVYATVLAICQFLNWVLASKTTMLFLCFIISDLTYINLYVKYCMINFKTVLKLDSRDST